MGAETQNPIRIPVQHSREYAPQPAGPTIKALESHQVFASFESQSGTHLQTVIGSGPTQGVDTHQLFYWFDVDLKSMSMAQSAKISSATDDYLFSFCSPSTLPATSAWSLTATSAVDRSERRSSSRIGRATQRGS